MVQERNRVTWRPSPDLRAETLILQTSPDRSGQALDRIRLLFRARAMPVGHHAPVPFPAPGRLPWSICP